jgi:glycogen debranching enzyme
MNLIENHWPDLVGDMPMKICYPALEGAEWRILTGSDPKNVPWSYHNAGSWPSLLWLLSAVAVKVNKPELAETALEIAAKRLSKDSWPEYYDGRSNRLVGKEARKLQLWTMAGFITAHTLLSNPKKASLLTFDEEAEESTCELKV